MLINILTVYKLLITITDNIKLKNMRGMKKIPIIFNLAFLLNLIWENLHSYLYVHYQGGTITQLVLIRAALFDAIFITLLALIFIAVDYFNRRLWWSLIIGIVFAIILERWALDTGRWAYNDLMPIIPLLKTGLTPTLQLGLLSFSIYKLVKINKK